MATLNATEKPESAHCEESVLGLGDEESKVKVGYSGARTEQTRGKNGANCRGEETGQEVRLVDHATLWLMYWLNCLDRNAIALARLDHIEEDLGLTGTRKSSKQKVTPFPRRLTSDAGRVSNMRFDPFCWLLIGQVPSNMFITRTKPSYYMSVCMALWTIVSSLTAVSRNFTGLSIFYTRKEIATRISILYTGNILATAFAGLIAAGVFSGMSGTAGISGWQWLFILQGAVTFAIAIAAAFTLPDDPTNTRWLT
ncbi:major facilitator superfamily domain-containing protein [Lipomyces tetrasporus]